MQWTKHTCFVRCSCHADQPPTSGFKPDISGWTRQVWRLLLVLPSPAYEYELAHCIPPQQHWTFCLLQTLASPQGFSLLYIEVSLCPHLPLYYLFMHFCFCWSLFFPPQLPEDWTQFHPNDTHDYIDHQQALCHQDAWFLTDNKIPLKTKPWRMLLKSPPTSLRWCWWHQCVAGTCWGHMQPVSKK